VAEAVSGWSVRVIALLAACAVTCSALPTRAHDEAAAAAPKVVRDTEIENAIRTLETPVWHAAGLVPNDVGIYLVQDKEINSFVAGGEAIFINTGLVERAQTPDQLIGVLAHETGHIVGGHIFRTRDALRNAGIAEIIAMVAAAGAAVAAQNGAPLLGAPGVGERDFAHFSVGQEATADHAAMNFLDRACQSARGLLQFFQILQSNEMLAGDNETAYVRTHPLTAERIEYVRDHVQHARCSNVPDSPAAIALLRLIKMKLHAFLDPPSTTLAAYPESDKSVLARYARAIAYYRIPDLAKALPAIDGLIHDFPENPYYRELKGQMLFENGHTREAIGPYEAAVRLLPSAPLLRIELSQVYIESGDPGLNKRAIAYLDDASRKEGRDGEVWHFLAVAYGRDHQMGMAALSLAEEALADGKKKDALQQSDRAMHLLARTARGYARAWEIHREAKQDDD
jgi:predicted Zn-dependent protease